MATSSQNLTSTIRAEATIKNFFVNKTETLSVQVSFDTFCQERDPKYATSSAIHAPTYDQNIQSTNYVIELDETSLYGQKTALTIEPTAYGAKTCSLTSIRTITDVFPTSWNQTGNFFDVVRSSSDKIPSEFQPRSIEIDSTLFFRDVNEQIASKTCPTELGFGWYNFTTEQEEEIEAYVNYSVVFQDFLYCELFNISNLVNCSDFNETSSDLNETSGCLNDSNWSEFIELADFRTADFSYFVNSSETFCLQDPGTFEMDLKESFFLGFCWQVLTVNETIFHLNDATNDNESYVLLSEDIQNFYVNISQSCLSADLFEPLNQSNSESSASGPTSAPDVDQSQSCFYFSNLTVNISWLEANEFCREKGAMLAMPENQLQIETILKYSYGNRTALGILASGKTPEIITVDLTSLNEFFNCSEEINEKMFEHYKNGATIQVFENEMSNLCFDLKSLNDPIFDSYVCQSGHKTISQMVLDCDTPGSVVHADPVTQKPTCYQLIHFNSVPIGNVTCNDHFQPVDLDLEDHLTFFKSHLLNNITENVIICGKTSMNGQNFMPSCDATRIVTSYFESGPIGKDQCFYYSPESDQVEHTSCSNEGNFSILCQKTLTESFKILVSADRNAYSSDFSDFRATLNEDDAPIDSISAQIGEIPSNDASLYSLSDLGCTYELKVNPADFGSSGKVLVAFVEILCPDYTSGIRLQDLLLKVTLDAEVVYRYAKIVSYSEQIQCISETVIEKIDNLAENSFEIRASGLKVWNLDAKTFEPLRIVLGAKMILTELEGLSVTVDFEGQTFVKAISEVNITTSEDLVSWPTLSLQTDDENDHVTILKTDESITSVILEISYLNSDLSGQASFGPVTCNVDLNHEAMLISNISVIEIGNFISASDDLMDFYLSDDGKFAHFSISSVFGLYPFDYELIGQKSNWLLSIAIELIWDNSYGDQFVSNNNENIYVTCHYTMVDVVELPILFETDENVQNLIDHDYFESMNQLILFQESLLPGTCATTELRVFLPPSEFLQLSANLTCDICHFKMAEVSHVGRNLLDHNSVADWLERMEFHSQSNTYGFSVVFTGEIFSVFPSISDNVISIRLFVCVDEFRVLGEVVNLVFSVYNAGQVKTSVKSNCRLMFL